MNRWMQVALLAALTTCAGFAFAPVYEEPAFAWVTAVAGVASVGLWVLVRDRWPDNPLRRIGISLAGYLVLMAVGVTETAFVILPSPATVPDLVDGIINGWPRLLSTSIPVAGDPSVFVVAPTLVWLSGVIAAEVEGRVKSPFAPVAPSLAVFVAGVYLSGIETGSSLTTVAVYLALALMFRCV